MVVAVDHVATVDLDLMERAAEVEVRLSME